MINTFSEMEQRVGGDGAARAALREFLRGWQALQVADEADDDYGAALVYLLDLNPDLDVDDDHPFDLVDRVLGEGEAWARDELDVLRYGDVQRTPLMNAAERYLSEREA